MNSNIVPLRLRPHLVSFLMKEMQGEAKTFAGYRCKVLNVPRHSFVGTFLLSHLEKIDYPVKDIHTFNIFLDVKAASRHRFVASGKIYKVEEMGRSFVHLPEKYSQLIYNIFEQQYRTAFYNYVEARVENNVLIAQAIMSFIDKYDLFEANVTQIQLRKMYYRLKKDGLCFSLQNNLRRK